MTTSKTEVPTVETEEWAEIVAGHREWLLGPDPASLSDEVLAEVISDIEKRTRALNTTGSRGEVARAEAVRQLLREAQEKMGPFTEDSQKRLEKRLEILRCEAVPIRVVPANAAPHLFAADDPGRQREPDKRAERLYRALTLPKADLLGASGKRLSDATGDARSTIVDTLKRMEDGEHGTLLQGVARAHRQARQTGAHSRSRRRLLGTEKATIRDAESDE